jgi:hypothetical protein
MHTVQRSLINDGSFKALVDVCATLRDERHLTAWYAGLSSHRGCAQARIMVVVTPRGMGGGKARSESRTGSKPGRQKSRFTAPALPSRSSGTTRVYIRRTGALHGVPGNWISRRTYSSGQIVSSRTDGRQCQYRRHDERACRRSPCCERIAKYLYSRQSNGVRLTEHAMVSGSKLEDGNPITEFSPLRPHHPLHSSESRGDNSKVRFMRYTLETAHWRVPSVERAL